MFIFNNLSKKILLGVQSLIIVSFSTIEDFGFTGTIIIPSFKPARIYISKGQEFSNKIQTLSPFFIPNWKKSKLIRIKD